MFLNTTNSTNPPDLVFKHASELDNKPSNVLSDNITLDYIFDLDKCNRTLLNDVCNFEF